MTQEWFEMKDIRRKKYNKSVWIPLRASFNISKEGKYGYLGYKNEYFGTGSVAFPVENMKEACKLGWMDIGFISHHSGYSDGKEYTQADVFNHYNENLKGVHLVLEQEPLREGFKKWHLHQDIVLSLGLEREEDVWVCPSEGYAEAARLKRNQDGKPYLLEIKSQYLKDYLCARNMGLYMTSYHERGMIADNDSFISWEGGRKEFINDLEKFEGNVVPLHKGGNVFGSKAAIFHIERTDVELDDEIPDLSDEPSDINTTSKSWEKSFSGEKVYSVSGRLWFNDWIEPGKYSPRVRYDQIKPTTFFIIDAEGNKIAGDDLRNSGKWLWFKPQVIIALCHRRGGDLQFYTKNTGEVSCSYGDRTHFGVNELNYINVYAKDISILPEWEQQVWAGYNITPEGGISKELYQSQIQANPSDTQAPEAFLEKGLNKINKLSTEKLGIKILRSHEEVPKILKKTHRFRAFDKDGFYSLAKDITRVTVDSLNISDIKIIASPNKKVEWASLKSLENLLAIKVDTEKARKITKPLIGIYELRHGDAHLPGSKLKEALEFLEIDCTKPYVDQGYQLLHQCVISIFQIVEVLENWETTN